MLIAMRPNSCQTHVPLHLERACEIVEELMVDLLDTEEAGSIEIEQDDFEDLWSIEDLVARCTSQ